VKLDCKWCGVVFDGKDRRTKFHSKKCAWASQRVNNQKNKRIANRTRLIREFGGECQQCGYRKNYAALHFHHIRDKLFPLSKASMTKNYEDIREEATKCILLCSNCHMETHHPQEDIPVCPVVGSHTP